MPASVNAALGPRRLNRAAGAKWGPEGSGLWAFLYPEAYLAACAHRQALPGSWIFFFKRKRKGKKKDLVEPRWLQALEGMG